MASIKPGAVGGSGGPDPVYYLFPPLWRHKEIVRGVYEQTIAEGLLGHEEELQSESRVDFVSY